MAIILRYFTAFGNGPYLTEFVYDVVVKQLLGLHRFQNLLLIVYDHINKNSSADEIANVNSLTTISHTRRPTSKYRKRDKPTSFNKLDDRYRKASTAHEVLNFSICYSISTSQLL